MNAYKVTKDQMETALAAVNEKYDGNIMWNRFEPKGSGFAFTLRCKSSKDLGHRITGVHFGKRRRHVSACWHVHGDFFDALFNVAPKAYVRAGRRRIDATQGNWEDRNIGSMMYPVMHSEACDCDRNNHKIRFGTLSRNGNGSLVESNVRMIKQSNIGKCPFVIMMPSHYREDGSCKCNDPAEREMMKRDWEYTDKSFREAGLIK